MIIIFALTFFTSVFILISALRHKVLREIGFRNIFRRKSTTILVIFGSLIGTALISGSLTLGDSFNTSTRNQAENTLGEIDATLKITKNNSDTPFNLTGLNKEDELSTIFNHEDIDKFSNSLDKSKVDGNLPALLFSVSIVKGDKSTDRSIKSSDISVSNVDLIGFENKQFGNENIDFSIPSGSTIISKDIAQRLDISEGDIITVFTSVKPLLLRVYSINDGKGASLYNSGNGNILVSPNYLRDELNLPSNTYNRLFVSSKGSAFEPTYNGSDFETYLNTQAENNEPNDAKWVVKEEKTAKITGGNDIITYAFLGVSLVGIIAGILLIINIYSMLAEERKSEMGTLRALALTRGNLIKTFLYEGFAYSILSSIAGVFVGIGVGYLLLNSITDLASKSVDSSNFNITFSTSPESWLISFSIGMLITFFTSYFASRRISRINIVSAIRNQQDEKNIKITKLSRFKNLIQILLIVIFIFLVIRGIMILNNSDKVDLGSIISKEALGGYMIFIGIVGSSYTLSIVIGKFLSIIGKEKYTRIAVTLLNLPPLILSCFIGNISLFTKVFDSLLGYSLLLLAGITVVITLTTIFTYNIDIFLWFLQKIFKKFSALNGIIKLSLRYSYENKFRTGLTILMFAIVLFLVAFLSVFKQTFDQQLDKFIPKNGYDAFVQIPKNINPDDVKSSVKNTKVVDEISVNRSVSANLDNIKYSDIYKNISSTQPNLSIRPVNISIFGITNEFIKSNPLKLSKRLDKFNTDEDAINASLNDGKYIFLTPQSLGPQGALQPPDKLQIGKTITINQNGKKSDVIIAGYLDQFASQNYSIFQYGMISGTNIFENVLDSNYVNQFYVNNYSFKLKDNGISRSENLKTLQKSLIEFNVAGNLFSIASVFQSISSFILGAINILQGFLSFALCVGIAGISIIMVRSVNERKQQIGMLRSLGFLRSYVLLSFFIESSFIILLGIIVGLISGVVTGNALFSAKSNSSINAGISASSTATAAIPYNELIVIGIIVYLISIAFTIIPSYKASRLAPVEATNYLD